MFFKESYNVAVLFALTAAIHTDMNTFWSIVIENKVDYFPLYILTLVALPTNRVM